ncbi:MAG TPA: DUF192 domain-containing protein [Bacillota bacterium]|nr:DUF192 domain-containing protein [Bacillota bacterium]
MFQTVKVINATRQTVLLKEARVADRFGSRLKGLLGTNALPSGQGLLLVPCRSVHTCGMRFPIDVGFVDPQGRLCRLIHRMPPCRFSPVIKEAAYVLEAPAGTFAQTGTMEGDAVTLEPPLLR